MSLCDELGAALDGTPIGRGSLQVVCDLRHTVPKAVDTDERVQYEVIRIDDAVTIYDRVGLPCYDRWIADLLRCGDCEIESLSEPTKDFDEALIELDIRWDGDGYVLDGSDVTVLDYSPVDDGGEPPVVPASALKTLVDTADAGMLRRSRMSRAARYFRKSGEEEVAARFETSLEKR